MITTQVTKVQTRLEGRRKEDDNDDNVQDLGDDDYFSDEGTDRAGMRKEEEG